LTRRVIFLATVRDKETIMENQTTGAATDDRPAGTSNDEKDGAQRLAALFRTRMAGVKAQLDAAEARARQRWQEVPVKVRGAFQQAFGKVRDGLDLPSRREVSSLAARIEELDRKLGEYQSGKESKKRRGEVGAA
jgi:hypothetical protein